jgi:hypothetical protein
MWYNVGVSQAHAPAVPRLFPPMATPAPFQERLAIRVVIWGAGFVAVYSAAAVIAVALTGDGTKTAETAKDILNAVLPVVGTWIGTVLAFYFGKENYRAAAEETRLSLGQHLSKPAINFALKLADFAATSISVPDRAAAKILTLTSIKQSMGNFYRVPVLNNLNAPLFVIHRQPVDSFRDAQSQAPKLLAAPAVANLTLADLLNDPVEGPRVQNSYALIPESATLADAKTAMATRSPCQDVFITKNGRDGEAVIAWLTNNDIQQAASA